MNSMIENYFQVMRHLLNQSMNSKFQNNDNLLIIIWSLMAVILTSCFSGLILNKIIIPEYLTINSFEELIDLGLKVYTTNDSWVWWQMKSYDQDWSKQLDEKIHSDLYPRIDYITREEQTFQVYFYFIFILFS